MTVREVFELQRELRNAQEKLSELARELDGDMRAAQSRGLLVVSNWMDSPTYRREADAVHALEERVAAAQREVGGKVYRVPDYKLADLLVKVEKVAKRARKLGVGEVTITVADRERVEVKGDGTPWDPEATSMIKFAREYAYVVLAGEPPVLEGWRFLATLQHLGEGQNIVKRIPGQARAWSEWRAGRDIGPGGDGGRDDEAVKRAQEQVDAVDLTLYRAAAPKCDHCGFDRRRKNTYVVEYAETGDLKQVGSNCLADFVGGVDPHRVAKYAEYLTVLDLDLEEGEYDDENFGGNGMTSQFTQVFTRDYLTHVATMLRSYGWVPRSAAGYGKTATADDAMSNLWAMARDARGKRGDRLYVEPADEDAARADAALLWAREVLPEKAKSEFDYNLVTMAAQDYVPKKGDGILAYVVVAHARALEQEVKLAEQKKKTANSTHFGEVKKRYDLTLTVEAIFETEGYYGTTFITRMLDGDGNVFKWFGSYELDRGGVYAGKWTVKGHEEYKGTLETVVTRPGGLEKVGESEGLREENERVERAREERAKFEADYYATAEALRAVNTLRDGLPSAMAAHGDGLTNLRNFLSLREGRLAEEWKARSR
jgi:hypothetical protein